MTDAEKVLKKLREDTPAFFDFGLGEVQNRFENEKYNQSIKYIFVPCNFELWIKKKLWTVHEASVIFLGLEPSVFLGCEQRYFYLKDTYKGNFRDADFKIYCEIAYFTLKRTQILKEIERGVIEKAISVTNTIEQAYIDASAICHFFMARGMPIPKELLNFAKENIDPVTIWEKFLENEQDEKTAKVLSVYFYHKQGKTWKEIASIFNVRERTTMRWVENGKGERLRQEKGLPELPYQRG